MCDTARTFFDVYLAGEAFLTATSYSILPVACGNGKTLGAGASMT